MNEYLNRQLDQISKLISGLKGGAVDLEKLTELDRSLEVLSHQIKTARLVGFTWSPDQPGQGLRQDALFFFNSGYKVIRFVGSYENIFGSHEAGDLPDVGNFFSPDAFSRFKEKTSMLLETGEQQAFQSEIISKNGLSLPVHFLLEKVVFGKSSDAVAAGMVFFRQTPSDLEDYRDILIENLPGMDVFLFDKEFRYVLSGGREKERMKLSNADFAGKTLFEVFDEKTQKRLFPFYSNALDGKVSEGEIRIGGHIYFISATPVFGFDGKVAGGALISQNVTKEKEVEKNLINARRQAEEADHAKSLFLANMSHEIRTPLNAIIGFTGLLNKTKLSPKQIKFSRLIRQSSEHLLSVVNEVLFLFKLGMGKVYIEKVPFNAYELVQNVYDSLFFRAAESGLDFRFQIEKDLPEVVVGDPFRMKQILINLAGNAIKFTDNGAVLIRVSCEKKLRKSVFFRFEVSDTGIGIPKEDLNKIFDEFTQSQLGHEKKRKGVGLGLTIVNKLVDLLNGRLHVESEPGQGSVFTVVIPFRMAQEEAILPEEKNYGDRLDLLSGKRVLYADDDENNILLAESILKDWNVDFELAYDGVEALSFLQKTVYDIVLLDIHMPGLSGLEVLKKMKKDPANPNRQTKSLAVTANIMESDIQEYLKSGFDDCILKPFTEYALYGTICRLLDVDYAGSALSARSVLPGTSEPGQKQLFDSGELIRIAGGDLVFFNKMLDTFIKGARDAVHSFCEGKRTSNWSEAGKKAHKVIPSFRYFRLTALVNKLERLENLILREGKPEAAEELAMHLVIEIEQVIKKAENAKIPDDDK